MVKRLAFLPQTEAEARATRERPPGRGRPAAGHHQRAQEQSDVTRDANQRPTARGQPY